jgi:hypothetical protein
MEPPNPVASTLDLPAQRSEPASRFDTARYRQQSHFMKVASWHHQQRQAVALRVQ